MRIFLSAPFTQYLAPLGSNGPGSEFMDAWREVVQVLRSGGHVLFSAHEREDWGARLNTPAEALAADLAGLQEADLVVAYIGSPPSPGVQLEIGFSLALRRRLLIFVVRGQDEPYLLRGIPTIADAEIVEISNLAEIKTYFARTGLAGPARDASKASG